LDKFSTKTAFFLKINPTTNFFNPNNFSLKLDKKEAATREVSVTV
jgi:hypothetical protein